jgi:hypothetical protein
LELKKEKQRKKIFPELPRQLQELQAFPEMTRHFRKCPIPAIACDIYNNLKIVNNLKNQTYISN